MLDIHQMSKTLVVKHKECSASLSKVKTLQIVFLTLLLFDTDCCFEAQNVTASVSFANVYLIQKYGMFLRGNFELKVETCGITAGLRVIFFTLTDKVVTWLMNFNLSVLKFHEGNGIFCFIWFGSVLERSKGTK